MNQGQSNQNSSLEDIAETPKGRTYFYSDIDAGTRNKLERGLHIPGHKSGAARIRHAYFGQFYTDAGKSPLGLNISINPYMRQSSGEITFTDQAIEEFMNECSANKPEDLLGRLVSASFLYQNDGYALVALTPVAIRLQVPLRSNESVPAVTVPPKQLLKRRLAFLR